MRGSSLSQLSAMAAEARRQPPTTPTTAPRRGRRAASLSPVARLWERNWSLQFPTTVNEVVPLTDSLLAVLTGRTTVDAVNTVLGELTARIHGPIEGSVESEQCWGLQRRGGHLAFAASSPLRHTVRLYDIASCGLRSVLDHAQRPANALYLLPNETELAAAGRRTGIRMYDLRTEEVVQHLAHYSYDVRCLEADDWRVVVGARDLNDVSEVVALFDRRNAKKLWHVRSREPVRNVHFTDDLLLYSSCGPVQQAAAHDLTGGVLDSLDFDAPLSELRSSSCPFSSLYEDLSGYNYNIVLETVYDDVTPNRLG